MKKLSFILVLVLVFTAGSAQAEDDGISRVVYHADFSDPRRFSAMITSINNMVTHYQSEFIDYDIRIVFVAHGIRFLTDDNLDGTPFKADHELEKNRENLKGRLQTLNQVHEVKLELCNITRSQINLDESKLYENVEMVPSGVVQVADLQKQGFAYIKIE